MNEANWQQHSLSNRLQSVLLLALICGFFSLIGWLLLGVWGGLLMLLVGMLLVIINPVASPALVMRLYGAQPISARSLPRLHGALQALAVRAGLEEMPTLYYIPSRALNAFAVGHAGRAAIGLTDGLLRSLSYRELVAVMAHEVSHIRSNDMWLLGLADLFSRVTVSLSLVGQLLLLLSVPMVLVYDWEIRWGALLLLVLAPNLSALAQLALSRTREYDADLNAVRLTGDPEGLIAALLRISRSQGRFWEHLLLPGRRNPEPSILRTHPPTEERIQRLQSLVDHPQRAQVQLVPISVLREKEPWQVEERLGRPVRRVPRWHINGLWH